MRRDERAGTSKKYNTSNANTSGIGPLVIVELRRNTVASPISSSRESPVVESRNDCSDASGGTNEKA